MLERGCDYCRDDMNMHFRHVDQVASSDVPKTVLLRCPQCGWLYEDDQRSEPVHLSDDDARQRFGYPSGL
jgi:hypothetical protein